MRIWLVLFALVCAALLYWRQGRARRLFEAAQAEFPAHPPRAEQLLEQSVLAAGGAYPEAQLLRCRALGAMDRWDEAWGLFSLIEQPATCEPRALLQLAREAERAGVDGLALLALDAADREGAEQAAVLKQRIGLELKDEAGGDVLEHCRRLAQLDPADPFPWQAEARVMQKRKEPLAAVRAYREALERHPNERRQIAIRAELAGQLIESGDLAAARLEMDRLLARPESAAGVRMKNAYLLRLEGRTDEALAQLDQVLADSPDSAAGRMLRGIVYLDLARYAEAADDLGRAVASQTYNKEARYKLAQAYLKLGRSAEAAREIEASQKLTQAEIEIIELEPQTRQHRHDQKLIGRLAELYQQVGRTQDAERLLRASPAD